MLGPSVNSSAVVYRPLNRTQVCVADVDVVVVARVQCGKKLRFGSKVLKCKGELS